MPNEFFTDTVDGSGSVRGQVCLTVGNANLPTIAYATESGTVMLAERTANDWVLSELPGEPAARDEYRISVSLDTGAKPHVAYVSEASDHLIYGARHTAWEFEEVPTEGGLFPGRVRFPTMKVYTGLTEDDVRQRNTPHICYQAGLSLRLAAKRRRHDDPGAGPVWRKHVETVDESDIAEKGWFATLDFDPQDIVRIASFADFSAAGAPTRPLRLATMTPGVEFPGQPNSWDLDVLDGGDLIGEFPAMAHSIPGEGIVSYFDRGALALKVCMFGSFPESPAVEIVSTDVDNDDVRSSVGVSDQNRFCIVYGSGGQLRFGTRTGPGTFDIEDVDEGGGWPSLVFDDEGSAHIAHVSGGTLRYAIASRSDG